MISKPIEAIKGAVVEVSKDISKADEVLIEFGKVGSEVATEHIALGKLNAGTTENQIVFGGSYPAACELSLKGTIIYP